MNEWLTTGQMLDKLKTGEIAEGSTHWEIKKLKDGRIIELNSGDTFGLDTGFLKELWRIIPNYVSFEEAKKAYEVGKRIKCEYVSALNGEGKYFESFQKDIKDTEGSLSWYMITTGKWSIER